MLTRLLKAATWPIIHLGAVLLLVISMPYKSNINSVFLGLVVLIFLFSTPLKQHFRLCFRNKRILAFTFFFLLHVLSVFNSSNLAGATKDIVLKLPFLLLPISMAAFRRTPGRQKLILNAYIFNIFILSVVSFLKTYYTIFHGGLFNFKDVIGYDWAYFAFIMPEAVNVHAPYFSLYIGVALIFICHRLLNNFQAYSLPQKFGWLALSIYFLLFLAVLSSRTAIFATLFTLGIWVGVYLIRRGYTRYLIGFGITLFLILFSFYSYFPYLKKKVENRSGVSTRSYIWQAGSSLVKENILFGVGTGDIKDSLRAAYKKNGFEEGLAHTYNAHNQYLQTAIGLGAVGLIALLLVFFTLIAEALSTQNILLLAFVILFGLCCITESLLSRQHGIILFCFFSSVLPIFANVPKTAPVRYSGILK